MKKRTIKNNYKFTDSLLVNDATYIDYLERFKRIALSMFEWVNLPKSMNARWLERCYIIMDNVLYLKTKIMDLSIQIVLVLVTLIFMDFQLV